MLHHFMQKIAEISNFVIRASLPVHESRECLPEIPAKPNCMKNVKKKWITVGPGLARKADGQTVFARIRVNGGRTWRSTDTNDVELGKRWKQDWERRQWLENQGFIAKTPVPSSEPGLRTMSPAIAPYLEGTVKVFTVNELLDKYVEAGHPWIRKRKLKRKAARSVQNETYCLNPLRAYFGKKIAEQITLADCDAYYRWRNRGGYISKFKLRGKDVSKRAPGGDRTVDLNLTVLSNAFEFATRYELLKANPIRDRGEYADEADVRHCREVAPTPDGLVLILEWLEEKELHLDADITRFLAYSGLRLGEGLAVKWAQVDWASEVIHVKRSKKGVFPFVLILPELAQLLRRLEETRKPGLIFPSPFDPAKVRNDSSYRRRLGQAAKACGLSHVTPHGLRSYFVTQARQSGLTDAEIAELIGDKSGPTLISQVYGDVRPDHLLAVARKIQLTAKTRMIGLSTESSQPKPSSV
jgi:integrase